MRREGFYEWRKRKTPDNSKLLSVLKKLRGKYPCYGTQSLIDELPKELKCSYGKAYKLLRDNNLLCFRKRKPHGNTKRDKSKTPAKDLINRDFYSRTPGVKLFSDITEVRCADGKLYCCEVMDAFDGAIIGLSIENNMRAEMCTEALIRAKNRFNTLSGCIIHTDRGSQFTSNLYEEISAKLGFVQSMGAVGTCADNARIESFHSTLKRELIYRIPYSTMTREQVKALIWEWVETEYNFNRRNTANEHKLPPLLKREIYNRLLRAA